MKYEIHKIYEGLIEGEETVLLTTVEVCERCSVSKTDLLELVSEGIINPEQSSGKSLKFAHAALGRVRKAKRLERDLDLNLAGVALTMQLLDRIDDLEKTLKRLGYGIVQ